MNDLTNLRDEYNQLNRRIYDLSIFMDTDEFQEIDYNSRTIINIQFSLMKTYSECLCERIFRHSENT